MSEVIDAVKEFFSEAQQPGEVAPAPPSEFPKQGGSGSGTETCYSVEARCTHKPKQIGAQIFDANWLTVQFDHVAPPLGVPSGPPSMMRDKLGLYGYQAAQALRWWFHANAAAGWQDGCIETRLVKHEVKYSYSSQALSAHVAIGGEDRSGVMPDWGKK